MSDVNIFAVIPGLTLVHPHADARSFSALSRLTFMEEHKEYKTAVFPGNNALILNVNLSRMTGSMSEFCCFYYSWPSHWVMHGNAKKSQRNESANKRKQS